MIFIEAYTVQPRSTFFGLFVVYDIYMDDLVLIKGFTVEDDAKKITAALNGAYNLGMARADARSSSQSTL